MSVYNDALAYKKEIISCASELYNGIVNYKKNVSELQQVVNTMYDKDYNTTGANAKRARMNKIFTQLNSCKFNNASNLGIIKITVSEENVEVSKNKGSD